MPWATNLKALDKVIEKAKAENGVYGVIYRARCKVTGKVYIGQTTRTLSKRFHQHLTQDSCTYFHNAIEKHGTENFEIDIIDLCTSKEHLDSREKFRLALYGFGTPFDMTYNLRAGGEGGELSEDTKQRISEAWNGRKVAVDVYKIVGKGKECEYMFTSESIADAARRLRDDEGVEINTIIISNVLQGLYSSYKGFIFTKKGSPVPIYDPKETSLKIARLDKNTMEVLEIYESVRQAASWLIEHGYSNSKSTSTGMRGNIQDCCRGRFKTMYKFVWRFVDDDGKLISPENVPPAQWSTKPTPIQALDENTGEVVRTFKSKNEAQRWLIDEGKTVHTTISNLNKAIKHNIPMYGYFWREVQE